MLKSLTWEIRETPVMCGGKVQKNYKGLQRNDTKEVLSIVKDSYTPINNETFISLIHDIEKFGFEQTGFLEVKQGRKLLCWLKNTQNKDILGYKSNDYIVVGNSFDYSSSLFVGTTNTLLRCENQFSKLHRNSDFRILHSKNSTQKVLNFESSFENLVSERNLFYSILESFSEVKTDKLIVENFVKEVLNNEFEVKEGKKENKILGIKKMELENSILKEQNELGNNLFGLFNGITYYTTHKHQKDNPKHKNYFGNILGSCSNLNNKGWDFCLKLLMEQIEIVERLEQMEN